MGLAYRYQLYFPCEQVWEVLQDVTSIAEPHDPPAVIHFPGYERTFPFEALTYRHEVFRYDDAQLSFALRCIFPEDEAIISFLKNRGDEVDDLKPLAGSQVRRIPLSTVYLTIYQQGLTRPFPGLALFSFGTTGTKMSLLFDESQSIRETFTVFLERNQGVCGIFNRETGGGEVFWWKGEHLTQKITDPLMTPDEIEALLSDGKEPGN